MIQELGRHQRALRLASTTLDNEGLHNLALQREQREPEYKAGLHRSISEICFEYSHADSPLSHTAEVPG